MYLIRDQAKSATNSSVTSGTLLSSKDPLPGIGSTSIATQVDSEEIRHSMLDLRSNALSAVKRDRSSNLGDSTNTLHFMLCLLTSFRSL